MVGAWEDRTVSAQTLEMDDAQLNPRGSAGNGTQRSIVTLVGQFSIETRYPAAFFIEVFSAAATERAVRNALARLVARGFLVSSRVGRTTWFEISTAAKLRHERRISHLLTFGSAPVGWDGTWTIVLFSVPEDERALRNVMRRQLSSMGFSLLYDGAWVCPSDQAQEARESLATLGVSAATVIRTDDATGVTPSGELALALRLDERRSGYERFLEDYQPVALQLTEGIVPELQAVTLRTELLEAWRFLADRDRLVPDILLPADWPRAAARDLFCRIYDGLAIAAQAQVQAAFERAAPGSGVRLDAFTTDNF
jgi:phenylacetic acid degradation operon negative regulatory protein